MQKCVLACVCEMRALSRNKKGKKKRISTFPPTELCQGCATEEPQRELSVISDLATSHSDDEAWRNARPAKSSRRSEELQATPGSCSALEKCMAYLYLAAARYSRTKRSLITNTSGGCETVLGEGQANNALRVRNWKGDCFAICQQHVVPSSQMIGLTLRNFLKFCVIL